MCHIADETPDISLSCNIIKCSRKWHAISDKDNLFRFISVMHFILPTCRKEKLRLKIVQIQNCCSMI